MSINEDLTEEFLNRVKERYSIEELVEILEMTIDDFIDLTWDNLLENHQLQIECGIIGEDTE